MISDIQKKDIISVVLEPYAEKKQELTSHLQTVESQQHSQNYPIGSRINQDTDQSKQLNSNQITTNKEVDTNEGYNEELPARSNPTQQVTDRNIHNQIKPNQLNSNQVKPSQITISQSEHPLLVHNHQQDTKVNNTPVFHQAVPNQVPHYPVVNKHGQNEVVPKQEHHSTVHDQVASKAIPKHEPADPIFSNFESQRHMITNEESPRVVFNQENDHSSAHSNAHTQQQYQSVIKNEKSCRVNHNPDSRHPAMINTREENQSTLNRELKHSIEHSPIKNQGLPEYTKLKVAAHTTKEHEYLFNNQASTKNEVNVPKIISNEDSQHNVVTKEQKQHQLSHTPDTHTCEKNLLENDSPLTVRQEKHNQIISTDKKYHKESEKKAAAILHDEKEKISVHPYKSLSNLYIMGQGDAGQLGCGVDMIESIHPILLKCDVTSGFKQVSCGGMHTVALTNDGTVYTWGCNDEGALGREATSDNFEYVPMQVKFPKKTVISMISAGDSHSSAISTEGILYAWGTFRDSNGPIGLLKPNIIQKQPIIAFHDISDPCVQACSGNNHILLLTKSGRIFTLGSGDEGQLGRVAERFVTIRGGRRGISKLVAPEEVFILSVGRKRSKSSKQACHVVKIFCGKGTSFAITADGCLYGWGLNNHGQLGNSYSKMVYSPTLLKEIMIYCGDNNKADNLQLSGGFLHTMILNTNLGILYSVGDSLDGRLGCGDIESPAEFSDDNINAVIRKVDFQASDVGKITKCACGDSCSFAITSNGELYSWGFGCNLQLGVGDGEDLYIPTLVPSDSFDKNKVFEVSSGAQHTVVLAYN